MREGAALKQSEAFFRACVEKRDLEAVACVVSEEVILMGPTENVHVRGKQALLDYLRRDFERNPSIFALRFLQREETALAEGCAAVELKVEFSNQSLCAQAGMSLVVTEEGGAPRIRRIHTFAPASAPEEPASLTFTQRGMDLMERRLLEETVAGGILGGYALEPGCPLYCIDRRMLHYLGYDSQAAFLADTGGLLANSIHPDDLHRVEAEAKRQLTNGLECVLEYRMRRQDGGYIWIHDVGRSITVEKNRCAVISACVDVTARKRAQWDLEELRRRYQLAVESTDIGLWEYDIQSHRAYCFTGSSIMHLAESAAENLPESMIAMGLVREDCIEFFRQMHRRLEEGAEKVSGEIWFRFHSGVERCGQITYRAAHQEEGKAPRAYGICQDITRRKKAERRYAEEIRYRENVEAAIISSCRVNLTACMVEEQYHGGALRRDVPYDETFRQESAAHIIDPTVAETIYGEMAPQALTDLFARGKQSLRRTYAIRSAAKRGYWVKTTVNLMERPGSGELLAFFYTKDITRERALQNTMDTIIKMEYDFVIYVDAASGHYDMIAAKPSLQISREVQSGNYNEALRAHARDHTAVKDIESVVERMRLPYVLERLTEQTVYSFECDMRGMNGQVRRKRLAFSHAGSDGQDVVMTRTDIDDIVRAEKAKQETLEKALRSAREANRAKSEFMARMSHDMRTPMNGIIGLAELGGEVESLDEARDYFHKISKSGDYLMLLVNDTLEMNRIESGHLQLHPEPLDCHRLFQEIVDINRAGAKARQINFVTACAMPEHRWILADRERTMQIFNNLLSNAIKFTPRGGQVEFRCCWDETAGGQTQVVVRDNGIGISAAFLPKLFDAFEQENDSTLGENMGSGLGLSIVKSLVDLMGGDISVHSQKGRGTEFKVHLPLVTTAAPKTPPHPTGPLLAKTLEGRRILLCEDHPLNAEIAKALLEKSGAQVDHAENGQVGLDRFSVSNPGYYDAILMDIRMPVLDGLEATRRIRALPRKDAKTVPILAMTANAFQEDLEESRAAGMNEHLSKPIDPPALYAALLRHMP
ncbi:MAG: ATP-binding protein [Oscillospiraceae bacterium]|nr:ATP-binding protein [Oscillospiraceae bacterium]